VRPAGLDLLSNLTGTVSTLADLVGNVILPGSGDTSGLAVHPAVLRSTLGVDDSPWTGRGIGVAVIDSGLEMSPEFKGRVTAFYDLHLQ
jgi:hypothetical protein